MPMTQAELWETMYEACSRLPLEEREYLKAHATLARPVVLRRWNGHDADPEFTDVPLEAGTRVNVVMASRFGDVGITDNLEAENGYSLRIQCVSGGVEGFPLEPDEEDTLIDIEFWTPPSPKEGEAKEPPILMEEVELEDGTRAVCLTPRSLHED